MIRLRECKTHKFYEGRTYSPPDKSGSGILPVGQARALCRGLYPLLQATPKEVPDMAIYHMQAKVVSRGSGRSAVAASAYMGAAAGCTMITMASA